MDHVTSTFEDTHINRDEASQPFQVYSAAEFLDQQGPKWLVPTLVPFAGTLCIYGPPATGKTSLVLDFAVAASSEQPFLTLPILHKTAVLFLSLEGNVRDRLDATIRQRKLDKATLPLSLITEQIDICSELDQRRLQSTVENLRKTMTPGTHVTVVVDNLTVVLQGADENNPGGMGAAVAGLRRAFTDCTIILLHHSGHNKRLRGHTILPSCMDAILRVDRVKSTKNVHEIRPEKLRDAPMGGCHHFEICPVDIEHGGELINTSIVRSAEGNWSSGGEGKPARASSPKTSLSEGALLLLRIIQDLSRGKTLVLDKTVESLFFEQMRKNKPNEDLKRASVLRNYSRARKQLVDQRLVSADNTTKTISCG